MSSRPGRPPVRTTTFRVAGEPPLEIPIAARAGVDALYAPRRHLLDRLLVDAAAEAGAEVRHDTRVTRLLRDDHGRVTGVGMVDAAGVETTVEASYVVGADGIRSFVADAAGARLLEQRQHGSAVRYTYVRGLDVPGYVWGFGNGAAAGLIPTNDGEHCVFVATSPQRMRTLRLGRSADEVLDLLVGLAAPDLLGPLGDARRVSRHHGWAGTPGFRRQPWGPGWALVGDAGYYKDPIGSHGITDALRDAELLTRALLEALGGRDGSDALADYHRLRDAVSQDLLDVTDAIASYTWDSAEVQPLLRGLSAAMSQEVELLGSLPPATGTAELVTAGATPGHA